VVYASGTPLQPVGSYGESRNIPAARVVKIADGVTSEQAAAMMLKGRRPISDQSASTR